MTTIELTEHNRFLRWGPQDDYFRAWLEHFTKKGEPFRIATDGPNRWTIYKNNPTPIQEEDAECSC
jgi:hypothetical protein